MSFTIDPLSLVYAGIQVYKLYNDDKRFAAEMYALKAKNLDASGLLDALYAMRAQARVDAHEAVERMPE